jgi:hypothetical protein
MCGYSCFQAWLLEPTETKLESKCTWLEVMEQGKSCLALLIIGCSLLVVDKTTNDPGWSTNMAVFNTSLNHKVPLLNPKNYFKPTGYDSNRQFFWPVIASFPKTKRRKNQSDSAWDAIWLFQWILNINNKI